MSYSSLFFQKRKAVPRWVLFFSAFSIVFCLFLATNKINVSYRKKLVLSGLQNVWVTNINGAGTDIVWVFDTKANTVVRWGYHANALSMEVKPEEHEGNVYMAHIDISGSQKKSIYFQIQSQQGNVYDNKGTKIWSVSFPDPRTEKNGVQVPAYGKVILPSGKPFSNGIVIFEVDGYYPLSSVTKQTGEWLIPLTSLIDKKKNNYVVPGNNSSVSIIFPAYPKTGIRIPLKDTRPLQKAIVIGASYSYARSVSEDEEMVLGSSTVNTTQPNSQVPVSLNPVILYPKENALIPGNKPLVRGLGLPGATVQILIQGGGKQYSYRTIVDRKGQWIVQYPLALEAGAYAISCQTKNEGGFQVTLTRRFSIVKSGEQVLGEATGSPTIMPTAILSPTTVPSPTVSIVPTVISSPIPTYIQTTLSPTLIPTTLVATPTPPKTGGGINMYLITAALCVFVGLSLVFVF